MTTMRTSLTMIAILAVGCTSEDGGDVDAGLLDAPPAADEVCRLEDDPEAGGALVCACFAADVRAQCGGADLEACARLEQHSCSRDGE